MIFTEPSVWRRVYIAHAISLGDRQANIRRAVAVGLELMDHGIAAMIPGLNALEGSGFPECSPGDKAYEAILCCDFAWLSASDAVLRLDVGMSAGADREERFAKRFGIPVFYSIGDVLTYLALPSKSNSMSTWRSRN